MNRRKFLTSMVAAPAAAIAFPAVAAAQSSRIHIVRITDFAFVPGRIAVKPGDRIRWINDDIAPHTATATDGSWDTGELDQGGIAEIPVTARMHTSYYCRFHPVMKAALSLSPVT
ncbi:MAG: copper-binding protein [Alphaproteobacteria bacterium]